MTSARADHPSKKRIGPWSAARWLIFPIWCLLAVCILCEVGVRVLDLDWDSVRLILSYSLKMTAHVASPDPRLLYVPDSNYVPDDDLVPDDDPAGTSSREASDIEINSLGCRGREPGAPGPGRRRVLVLGGSNVWGANVDNHETWPARLQERLSTRAAPVDVLNCGVSGYNAIQMCANMERTLARARPHLIVFAFSNIGPRMFFPDGPELEAYFDKDPTLWWDFIPPALLDGESGEGREVRTWLLGRSAIYRLWLSTLRNQQISRTQGHQRARAPDMPHFLPFNEPHYVSATQRCLRRAKTLAAVAVVIVPGVHDDFGPYQDGIRIPTLTLRGESLPADHRRLHPPAYVLDWTAKQVASWIGKQGLLTAQ